jgi:hypothetical protein
MTTDQIPVSPAHAAIIAMPHEQLQQAAMYLWDALCASNEETRHVQYVLGGWEDCPGCQAANDECNHNLACDAAKQRRRIVNDAWALR